MVEQVETVRAVIKKGDSYLLVQRALHDEGGGYWQFVGGHTDGQTPIQALKREVKEEVGLDVIGAKKLTSFISQHHGKTVAYYLTMVKSGNIQKQESEVNDARWFTLSEMKKLKMTEGAKKVMGMI